MGEYPVAFDWMVGVAMVLSSLLIATLHLYHRPELNDGKMLSPMQSYVAGLGTVIGAFVVLTIARGLSCQCWAEATFQIVIDIVIIAGSCALVTWAMRKTKPFDDNPQSQMTMQRLMEIRAEARRMEEQQSGTSSS